LKQQTEDKNKIEVPEHLISDTYVTIEQAIDRYEKRTKRRSQSFLAMRIAAVLLLISAASFLFFNNRSAIENFIDPISFQHIATLPGKRMKVVLSDGSIVWLNSGSRLSFSNRYNRSVREVKLEGEAYFEVSHNPKKPFLVHVGELTTKVLGTSFTINAYKESRQAVVTLITGKVWVKIRSAGPGNISSGDILLPDQRLQYDYTSKKTIKTYVASAASSRAWTEGKLIFDNTPMQEVAERLSRAFDLHVEVQKTKRSDCRIYGQFNMNQKPEEVVKMICKLIRATYTIQGNEVSINVKGC
jgi:ferric-dicitrate binding protein FerR (iron transport regulator)